MDGPGEPPLWFLQECVRALLERSRFGLPLVRLRCGRDFTDRARAWLPGPLRECFVFVPSPLAPEFMAVGIWPDGTIFFLDARTGEERDRCALRADLVAVFPRPPRPKGPDVGLVIIDDVTDAGNPG